MNKLIISGRVVRWLLFLQEFDITMLNNFGRENVIADYLSHLENTSKEGFVDDTFLNEYLFVEPLQIPWLLTFQITSFLESFRNISPIKKSTKS
jgi:hypothetical protein